MSRLRPPYLTVTFQLSSQATQPKAQLIAASFTWPLFYPLYIVFRILTCSIVLINQSPFPFIQENKQMFFFQTKSYYAKLLPEVLISRERLLATAKAAPPGPIPFLPIMAPKPSNKNNFKPLYVRAKQRYFEELSAIWSEVGVEESEDENYPEGPPANAFKKRKIIHPGQVCTFLYTCQN